MNWMINSINIFSLLISFLTLLKAINNSYLFNWLILKCPTSNSFIKSSALYDFSYNLTTNCCNWCVFIFDLTDFVSSFLSHSSLWTFMSEYPNVASYFVQILWNICSRTRIHEQANQLVSLQLRPNIWLFRHKCSKTWLA